MNFRWRIASCLNQSGVKIVTIKKHTIKKKLHGGKIQEKQTFLVILANLSLKNKRFWWFLVNFGDFWFGNDFGRDPDKILDFFGDEILGPENLVATKILWADPKVRITTSDHNDQKEHRILHQIPKPASKNSSWRSRKTQFCFWGRKSFFVS